MILPPYQYAVYEEQRSQRFDVAQIPYFIMAIALLVLFALTLLGIVPSYVLIVAWFIALSKCF